jgi:hypothetical protein
MTQALVKLKAGAQSATCGRLILARQHASASNQTGRAVEEHAEDP